MANNKFVVKNGAETPNIDFVSPNKLNKITVDMLDSDTLSVSGNSGQLFSITDSLTGTIFAVNDISGVPSIEVDDTGEIRLAETFGNVLIGTATDTGEKLQVNGKAKIATVDNGVGNFLTRNANGVITQRTAAEVLADIGGEGGFTKGNLVQGSNVTLSGTLTNRLVGTGDVTINADGTNLAEGIRTATTVLVTSSTGTGATLNIATATLAGMMSAEDKAKLNGIPSTAEENQHAFSNVAVSGQSTVSADSKTDTLTLVAGTNVTITTDAATDSITINASASSIDWANITNKPDPVITLAGDLTGSVTLTDLQSGTLTATIAENSVTLGTDTTGNYVAGITAGGGITVTGTAGEGWSPTVSHADTSSVSNLSSNNSGNTFVQDISFTFDTFGHVTAATVATGNVTSNWIVKNSAYTAVSGDLILADTSTGPFTITLPASPSAGHNVTIADGGNWELNNLTIARNGSTIEGIAEDLIADIGSIRIDLVYSGTTWNVTTTTGVSEIPPQEGNSGKFLTTDGTEISWANAGASIQNDTTTDSSTFYPTMAYNTTSGTYSSAYVSSSKLFFNPATGSLNATNVNSLSDSSKKKNIVTIDAALDKVLSMRGVYFDWADSGIKSTGVIAQEIETVLPEVVSTSTDGEKSVSYGNVVGILIEAIKELRAEIEKMKEAQK